MISRWFHVAYTGDRRIAALLTGEVRLQIVIVQSTSFHFDFRFRSMLQLGVMTETIGQMSTIIKNIKKLLEKLCTKVNFMSDTKERNEDLYSETF